MSKQLAKTTTTSEMAPRLPYHALIEERFGIDKASWKALVEAVFPGATTTASVILALSYCRARKLDPFKRCVHIVPIWDRQKKQMVDTIWPGIGELRTTAFRTREYAGRDKTEWGPMIESKLGSMKLTHPEWAQVTVYRMIQGQRVPFQGPQVYWLETYAKAGRDKLEPNEMWRTRVRGQIDKCAEAAALRAAFPEEIGGEHIAEEARTGTPVSEDEPPRLEQAEPDTIDAEPADDASGGPDAITSQPTEELQKFQQMAFAEFLPRNTAQEISQARQQLKAECGSEQEAAIIDEEAEKRLAIISGGLFDKGGPSA